MPTTVHRNLLLTGDTLFPVSQGPTSSSDETHSVPMLGYDDSDTEYPIDVYYRYIHPAHPFLLPRRLFLQNRSIFPDHLKNAMCFIASHHLANGSSEVYEMKSNFIFDPTIPDDGFKVQSLILVTLVSYARFERDKGTRALTTAIDLALRLGLNSSDFAIGQDSVFQESWRRTWWELYTITGLISLIAGLNLRLSQPPQMKLPTHCEEYETGQGFHVKTVQDMQQRFTEETNFKWSSFAYRIEAMRILSNVLELAMSPQPQADAVNASISSFLLSLPEEKREGMKDDGETDEVMSCALMIVHLASICLHLPRSSLAGIRGFKTVCGNDRGKVVAEESKVHHRAALRSAKALSDLITSRTTLRTLSPCFSCAIAFAAAVQLAECLLNKSPQAQILKEYVQLELSALNVLGETWPIALVVRSQLAQFSREVLGYRIQPPATEENCQEAMSSQMASDPTISDEPWLQDLISEDLDFSADGFLFAGPNQ
ncbi:uncharacterized protein A1O9_11083 [Exophiala aquamarina CBS 119918]|uniref:Xylanolytic transcriptional activator regulatory domain-containing protein n=1 Tax=Exophiala aquamarina CBS 119918 TaxID=1182545 RepID=A0A072NYL3_9EURO|nr:uncharacterized protein A1O9_11083 [Exophiala aquamarina CBS 119918]KEF52666.1 hypothetical protein A1O9_11083 [Exophiala aquamarina CBS 119918]